MFDEFYSYVCNMIIGKLIKEASEEGFEKWVVEIEEIKYNLDYKSLDNISSSDWKKMNFSYDALDKQVANGELNKNGQFMINRIVFKKNN